MGENPTIGSRQSPHIFGYSFSISDMLNKEMRKRENVWQWQPVHHQQDMDFDRRGNSKLNFKIESPFVFLNPVVIQEKEAVM